MIADSEFGVKKNLGAPVFEIFAVFPRIGRFLRFYKNKIEGNEIEASDLFRSTEGHNKMTLQKKKWKKVENSNFGGLFRFEILIFSTFEHFLAHFRFFRWICDSYGIHVIMLFLELVITKKMPEKIEKILKVDNCTQKLQNLTYVEKNSNILSQTQNIAFI